MLQERSQRSKHFKTQIRTEIQLPVIVVLAKAVRQSLFLFFPQPLIETEYSAVYRKYADLLENMIHIFHNNSFFKNMLKYVKAEIIRKCPHIL